MLHIVWQFKVRAGLSREFEEHYRGDGVWARLFRGGLGYRETRLLRDRETPDSYLTIDVWDDLPSYRAFLEAHAIEYKEIDERCAAFTDEERCVGIFEAI